MVAISQTKLQALTEELRAPFSLDLTSLLLQVSMTCNLLKAFYFNVREEPVFSVMATSWFCEKSS
jgi:hypothetical protein